MAARVIEARPSRLSRRILSSMGIAVLLTAGIIETSSAIELDVNGQVTVQFAGFVSYNKPGGGMLNAGSVELTGPFPGVPFFDGVAASSAAPGLLRAISTFSYATTVGGVLFLASSQAAF